MDGGNELFQLGDLVDAGTFVDEATHTDRKPLTIYIIRFFEQKIEQLGVAHEHQYATQLKN